ncbi:uncharacterized protein LOC134811307 [Bolinopsis microptera]|uniref:uncharacterized protein LOC134811307 n=1 Tax=Bolinopsis microptera TaxID=2820187 RepID=UPI0030795BBA
MSRQKSIFSSILLFLLLAGTLCTDCTSDKITISVDQIKDFKTGKNLPSTFADGDTYTIVCKYPATQVFTNDVRGQAEVNQSRIDEFDSATNSHVGQIVVKCKNGLFSPDIFFKVLNWCAVGCSPVPEDTNQHWKASYSDGSLSTAKKSAPIIPNIDSYINVQCREGYAPRMYQLGGFSTRCLASGYSPGLLNLVQCTAGCSDISAQVPNARVVSERSAVSGAAPYNIGSVATVICSNGYTLQGSQHTTCTSLQEWSPSVPVCAINSALGQLGHRTIVSTMFFIIVMIFSL